MKWTDIDQALKLLPRPVTVFVCASVLTVVLLGTFLAGAVLSSQSLIPSETAVPALASIFVGLSTILLAYVTVVTLLRQTKIQADALDHQKSLQPVQLRCTLKTAVWLGWVDHRNRESGIRTVHDLYEVEIQNLGGRATDISITLDGASTTHPWAHRGFPPALKIDVLGHGESVSDLVFYGIGREKEREWANQQLSEAQNLIENGADGTDHKAQSTLAFYASLPGSNGTTKAISAMLGKEVYDLVLRIEFFDSAAKKNQRAYMIRSYARPNFSGEEFRLYEVDWPKA